MGVLQAWVPEDARIAILHYKDAARAAIELSSAPMEAIESVNYLVDGVKPTPTAGELADLVRLEFPKRILNLCRQMERSQLHFSLTTLLQDLSGDGSQVSALKEWSTPLLTR